jgi:hypothetical protein
MTVTLALAYQGANLAQSRLSFAHTILTRTDLGRAADFATIDSVEGLCDEILHGNDAPNKRLSNTTVDEVRRFCSLRAMDMRDISIEDLLSFIADLFVFFGIAIESLTLLSPTWRTLLRRGGSACEPIERVAGHAGLVILLFGIAAECALVYWRPFGGFDTYRIVTAAPHFAEWHIPYLVLALLATPWVYVVIRALIAKGYAGVDIFDDWGVL